MLALVLVLKRLIQSSRSKELRQFVLDEFEFVVIDHDVDDGVGRCVVAFAEEALTLSGRSGTRGGRGRCVNGGGRGSSVDGRQQMMLDVIAQKSDVVVMSKFGELVDRRADDHDCDGWLLATRLRHWNDIEHRQPARPLKIPATTRSTKTAHEKSAEVH